MNKIITTLIAISALVLATSFQIQNYVEEEEAHPPHTMLTKNNPQHEGVAGSSWEGLNQGIQQVLLKEYFDYLNSVKEAAEKEESYNTSPVPITNNGVGECTGFAIPDYIIKRESGGQANAVNSSSGAYGCAQTMPEHYAANGWGSGPGSCYGLDMTSIEGQRQCVLILSNGGTNLDPWNL
jgi:hypothetical protein